MILAPKELWKLFEQLAAELSDFKKHAIVLLSPLPSYLGEACCADADHMPNRSLPTFKKELEDALFKCRANLKDFAFHCGLRKIKTISTWGVMRKKGATGLTQRT
jgi:hypothetical protein